MRTAAVFDLDGTPVHSAPDLAHSLNHVLATHGLAPVSTDAVSKMIGNGMVKLVERGFAHAGRPLVQTRFGEAYDAFERHYRQHAVVDSTLYPETERTLDVLKKAGMKLAVCTNKHEAIARHILETLGVAGRFDAIVGGAPGRPRKPNPAALLEAVERLGAGVPDAVMIGDSEVDLEAARAAAIPIVLVGFGYCRRAPGKLGADACVDAMCELPRVLAILP